MPDRRKAQLHFIPNTHLDREWSEDFQHARQLTVQFLDSLIGILKKVPEYHFLLDSQVVPLEDYFEIRPENRPVLERYIREGRLNIGPWYTAPDMNCISGESVVRNILLGHRIGATFGGPVMKVGYTPFGFVHTSQLPQVYSNFGIDFCIFYRGINADVAPKAEFYWEGADGTRILASRLGKGGRCSFYFAVYRKAFFKGPDRLGQLYNWVEDGQLPFKLCDEDVRGDHGYLVKPSRKLDEEALGKAFRELIKSDSEDFATPEIPFMHGMDTSMPDIREDEIMRHCQAHLEKGERFFYSSMPRYAAAVKKAVGNRPLTVIKGEMQYPTPYWVMPGRRIHFINFASTRVKMKIQLAKAENNLIRRAEPLATFAWMMGAEWPQQYLRLAWKELLKCHPHDTIGGCTIDRAEEDATARLNQVLALSQVVTEDSLGHIQSEIDTSDVEPGAMLLTVVNPSPFERSEVVTSFVDIPRELNMKRFTLVDDRGKSVHYVKSATGHIGKLFRDRTDLALFSTADENRIRFLAEKVPALGYKTYVIRPGAAAPAKAAPLSPKARVLENEFLSARINDDGTIDLTNKKTGRTFKGLHYFEDGGEAGHPWQHNPPEKNEFIISRGGKARIKMVENNDLQAGYQVLVRMKIPETTDFDKEKRIRYAGPVGASRSKKRKTVDIFTTFTLARQGKALQVETRFNNTCRNHRLRVMFPTRLAATHSHGEIFYDVAKRVIDRGPDHPFAKSQNPDYNFLRFVDLSDKREGLAFLGRGLHEYEAVDNAERTLAVTLVRSCEIRLCVTPRWDFTPGDLIQSQGENVSHYALYPHAGGYESGGVLAEADRFNLPMMTAEAGPSKGGTLPRSFSFLAVDGDGLVLSAVKKAEDGNKLIVRVNNSTTKNVQCAVKLFRKVKSAAYVTMNEQPVRGSKPTVKDNVIGIQVGPKKVVTLAIAF